MGKCLARGQPVKYLDKCCEIGRSYNLKRPNLLRGPSCGICPHYRGYRGERWDRKFLVIER